MLSFFGFSKLGVPFGERTPDDVRLPYAALKMPGVDFRQEQITAIDPQYPHVRTRSGSYRADVLVVALGAK
ncbi:FAD/NAD(P)-binding oxidoreductase [Mycobacterium intracellulare]|jgi:sulfide:quinone oxidoreductase|uniref:FAD/NAD(P)-binding oxidoreductase n=1 Tax=Mycobacterium intracellulare TaxID=1767 RepID=UPI000C79EBD9|nr:FAD/NAD(P)-binding oxidoreductase [Mycobacterium intracellulare]